MVWFKQMLIFIMPIRHSFIEDIWNILCVITMNYIKIGNIHHIMNDPKFVKDYFKSILLKREMISSCIFIQEFELYTLSMIGLSNHHKKRLKLLFEKVNNRNDRINEQQFVVKLIVGTRYNTSRRPPTLVQIFP